MNKLKALVPSHLGAGLIALLALAGPVIALLRAFNVDLSAEQVASITAVTGGLTIAIQRFTGQEPDDG